MSLATFRCISITRVGVGVLLLAGTQAASAQAPDATPATLQHEQLQELDRLAKDVDELRQAGKLDEAVNVAARALELERRAVGEIHPRVAEAAARLAELHELQGDWGRAVGRRKDTLAVRVNLDGKAHWRTTDARLALAFAEKAAAMGKADQARIDSALRKEREVVQLETQGKFAEAEQVALEALETYRALLGPETADVARVLHRIGRVRNDARGAKDPYERAVRIRRNVLPPNHPDLGRSLNNLAMTESELGNDRLARELLEEAVRVWRASLASTDLLIAMGLANLGKVQRGLGENRAAKKSLDDALAISRKSLPSEHPAIAATLDILADVNYDLAEFVAAKNCYEEALAIRRKAPSPNEAGIARKLYGLGRVNLSLGEHAAAKQTLEEALAVSRRVLPSNDPNLARILHHLGLATHRLREYAAAKPHFVEALAIRRTVLNNDDPEIAISLNDLGALQYDLRDFPAAKQSYEEALGIFRKAIPRDQSPIAQALSNLGLVLGDLGEYVESKKSLEEALAIQRASLPEGDPLLASSLENLGSVQLALHQWEAAKKSLAESLLIRRKTLPAEDPAIAYSLNKLASAQGKSDDNAAAKASYEEAIAILRKSAPNEQLDLAATLLNLGALHTELGEYAAAKENLQDALACRDSLPENHPLIAVALNNLGAVHYDLRDYAAAKARLEEALTISRKAVPSNHSGISKCLLNLGRLALVSGVDAADAVPRLAEAIELNQNELLRSAVAQAEQEQLSAAFMARTCLQLLIGATITTRTDPALTYDRVARVKGSVTALQRWARQARNAADPETARMMDRLRQVTQQIVGMSVGKQLSGRSSDPQDVTASVRALSEERLRLEQQLTERSEIYRTIQSRARVGTKEIRDVLPEGAALIDLVEYGHISAPAEGAEPSFEVRLSAFVIRPKQEGVVLVPLGPTDTLAELIDQWRATYGAGKAPPPDEPDKGAELRKRLWEPLAQHLKGVKLVLVSPEGPLNGLPWAALPGSTEGTFLVHEYAFAVVPVPQLLPELPKAGLKPTDGPAALIMGNIDFDAVAGPAGQLKRENDFLPLPGTMGEADAVHRLSLTAFAERPNTLLSGKAGTKDAFLSLAPQYSHILVATHGFFLPEPEQGAFDGPGRPGSLESLMFRRNLMTGNPALRSGLVFAGANYSTVGHGDAFLTALEASELDLARVDLAVLSACETGLGKVEGGEGVLGLQRAFQLAGARTAVTSLWKVPDGATKALMTRFHGNLWEKRMGKLEALREAQMWLLREARAHPELLRSGLARPDPKEQKREPLSPFYWAAFVLSGDWR